MMMIHALNHIIHRVASTHSLLSASPAQLLSAYTVGPGWYASFHDEGTSVEGEGDGQGDDASKELTRQPLHGRVSDLSAGLLDLSLTASNDADKERGSNTVVAVVAAAVVPSVRRRTGLEGRRLLPVCVKDVAGLVPGAYKGRGKGNRFLSDLCDADVLVHVVDVTGQADRDGNAVTHHHHHHHHHHHVSSSGDRDGGICSNSIGSNSIGGGSSSDVQAHDDTAASTAERGSNPIEDAEWIREELHRWIYGNVRAKWDSVVSKKNKHHQHNAHRHEQCAQRVYQLFTGYQGPKWCLEVAARRAGLALRNADQWSDQDLHRIVAHFLCVRFPICLALNKIDMLDGRDGMSIIDQCREAAMARGEVAVPVSSRAECCLLKKMLLAADTTEVMGKDPMMMMMMQHQQTDATTVAEESILLDVMNRFGSTGVLEVSCKYSLHPQRHDKGASIVYTDHDGSTNQPICQAISAAVRLRPPVLCYPVHDLDSEYPVGYSTGKTISNTIHPTNPSSSSSSSLSSSTCPIPRLLDCIQFKPGSTVGDVYEALKRPGVLSHTVLSGE
jgi:ribosome-binding ATPase YchF (GTP1/OBG family)